MPAGLGNIYAEGPYSMLAVGAIRRGRAVKIDPSGSKQVTECNVAGEAAYGHSIHTKEDGDQVSVLRQGRSEVAVAGAALPTINTNLAVDAQARYIPAVAGNVIVGKNLTTAAAADDEFTIQLDIAGNVA